MRRYRRSRFRTKSSWIWADKGSMTLDNASGTVTGGRRYNASAILPVGRIKWLCDSAVKRTHVTVTGILLWLDFHWQTTSTAGLPDIDFYIDKTAEDDAGNVMFVRDPFFEPQLPSAMAAWTDAASDGLDGFMWTHHMKGMSPPNAVVRDTSALKGNQFINVPDADADHAATVCRAFSVRAEWQPDVHVKVKRRLLPNEGLIIGMSAADAALPNGMHADLDWSVRIVGR